MGTTNVADIYGTSKVPDEATITLGRIYALLVSCVRTCETKLNSAILRLEGKDDIGQEQLLALQAKIQAWGNLTSTATGLLRAVGDSLKSTTQNIR
ncbi:MAG: hypothetical protein LBB18_02280 [Puniceicoccales bacterium]|jgi:hypothetical protein|nr:hypothetical protein [Puniceicoccales bacterium]